MITYRFRFDDGSFEDYGKGMVIRLPENATSVEIVDAYPLEMALLNYHDDTEVQATLQAIKAMLTVDPGPSGPNMNIVAIKLVKALAHVDLLKAKSLVDEYESGEKL